jgi:GxxExxY protein
MTKEKYNYLAKEIVDACYQVHKELGPGLLESAFIAALMIEFDIRCISVKTQVQIELFYKGYNTGKYYVIDLLIEDEIILELKCCTAILPVHEAQIISYLKLANKKLGFIINFHVPLIKDGIKRFVNNF